MTIPDFQPQDKWKEQFQDRSYFNMLKETIESFFSLNDLDLGSWMHKDNYKMMNLKFSCKGEIHEVELGCIRDTWLGTDFITFHLDEDVFNCYYNDDQPQWSSIKPLTIQFSRDVNNGSYKFCHFIVEAEDCLTDFNLHLYLQAEDIKDFCIYFFLYILTFSDGSIDRSPFLRPENSDLHLRYGFSAPEFFETFQYEKNMQKTYSREICEEF